MTLPESRRARTLKRILDARAVAVIRVSDPGRLLPVVEALLNGGVRGIEVTMTVPDALTQIRLVDQTFGEDAILGVGSVLSADTARLAIEAGARYVVSPILKPEIIAAAHTLDAAAMPGAFTPTEIQKAHEAGADIVKVFPANVVGMAFFRGVLAPMPHLRLMPTAGVTLTNAGEWLAAGACAVGVGSALLDRAAIESEDWQTLTDNARTLMRSISEAP
ncbi:MAG: bifunctional 4-hydroxy-2-oxoglutarate aldolase/2-dehydro-3-deoxy-phosphogluconate aldolase [Rhodothermales bacterium]|nr:bifunctional 4-hydroxy-2-oxoglutarate aldolase/2-dehydro-3-deoxy-phosphogluconate aldolase [Rhodothermales bacterium]